MNSRTETNVNNPYQAPEGAPGEAIFEVPRQDPRPGSSTALWWMLFGLNLPIPALFGMGAAAGTALFGEAAAVLMFGLAGWWATLRYPQWASRILVGAGVMAVSQVMPIPQLVAGMLALSIAEGVGFANTGGQGLSMTLTGFVGGFFVTTITGGILLGMTLCIGACLVPLWRLFFGRRVAKRYRPLEPVANASEPYSIPQTAAVDSFTDSSETER